MGCSWLNHQTPSSCQILFCSPTFSGCKQSTFPFGAAAPASFRPVADLDSEQTYIYKNQRSINRKYLIFVVFSFELNKKRTLTMSHLVWNWVYIETWLKVLYVESIKSLNYLTHEKTLKSNIITFTKVICVKWFILCIRTYLSPHATLLLELAHYCAVHLQILWVSVWSQQAAREKQHNTILDLFKFGTGQRMWMEYVWWLGSLSLPLVFEPLLAKAGGGGRPVWRDGTMWGMKHRL